DPYISYDTRTDSAGHPGFRRPGTTLMPVTPYTFDAAHAASFRTDCRSALMKSVAVFCASRNGTTPIYTDLARALGTAIAERGLALVDGGGRVERMGVLGDAALAAGGEVIGVIPQALMDKELGHIGISELHITVSIHERKARME